ncbi:Hypothetical protein GSB_6448 [Giardia duodenalis]|uniref:Uncharacterized protein n=2 Tax=Giardia intestinalis TaxID=5741 RepID=C6LWV1_GIAIB|nr:Hypothetical protein GL50581_3263 [Giardia intestinalis ATCC 50581]ESU45653.1 Hypothetical protein GSB_6448 [Giardia intestinalis]
MDDLDPVVTATIFEDFPLCVTKSLFRYCTVGISEKLRLKRYFVVFDQEHRTARIETTDPKIVDAIKRIFSVSTRTVQLTKDGIISEQKNFVLQRSLANIEKCEEAFMRDGVCAVDVISSSSDAKSTPAIIDFLQFVFSHVTFTKAGERVKIIVPQKLSKAVADALVNDRVSFKIYLPKVEVIEAHPKKGNVAYRVKVRLLLNKEDCVRLVENVQTLKQPPFFNIRPVDDLIDPW